MAVSYSGIGTYDDCPSKFKRKYITKEKCGPGPTRESAPQMFRGTDMHNSVEDLINDKRNDLLKGMEAYTQFCISLRTKGAKAELPFAFNKAWELVDFEDEEAEVRGFLDCIVADQQLIVYEWKSGKIYDSHVTQRHLYGLAALLMYPDYKTVRVISTYFDLMHNNENTYHRDMLKTYMWMWERKINKTKPPQPYPMRPSWKCKNCQFSKRQGGLCPN